MTCYIGALVGHLMNGRACSTYQIGNKVVVESGRTTHVHLQACVIQQLGQEKEWLCSSLVCLLYTETMRYIHYVQVNSTKPTNIQTSEATNTAIRSLLWYRLG